MTHFVLAQITLLILKSGLADAFLGQLITSVVGVSPRSETIGLKSRLIALLVKAQDRVDQIHSYLCRKNERSWLP